ncbi:MAG: hypothetical protein HFG65_02690 [Hungatella sp.]|nr:hypothetical protein [Hungatella sp.]
MRLVIGGYAQGKLSYVLRTYRLDEGQVVSSEMPEGTNKTVVFNHLHSWVKERILAGGNPERELETMIERWTDCILISDEIGNGIVPLEAGEREYRERLGRMLVEIAKRAESVERVFCGIGQRIK